MTDLELIQANGSRIVRAVARGTGELTNALLGYCRSERATWTLPEWKIVLKALDECVMSLEDWLNSKDEDWLK